MTGSNSVTESWIKKYQRNKRQTDAGYKRKTTE